MTVRIAIVSSRFNQLVTDQLVVGARAALASHGVEDSAIVSASVPGAFELPLVAQRLAASGEVDAVVCLGAVIRGGTDHYTHIARECAAGLQRVQLDTGVPVVFGVLTTDTLEQALERAGAKSGSEATDNKGFEAAETAVEMVGLLRRLPKETG